MQRAQSQQPNKSVMWPTINRLGIVETFADRSMRERKCTHSYLWYMQMYIHVRFHRSPHVRSFVRLSMMMTVLPVCMSSTYLLVIVANTGLRDHDVGLATAVQGEDEPLADIHAVQHQRKEHAGPERDQGVLRSKASVVHRLPFRFIQSFIHCMGVCVYRCEPRCS